MSIITPRSAPRRREPSDAFEGSRLPGPSTARHIVRSQTTRVIHLLLLVVVLHQLIGSEFMRRPFPGDPPAWPYSLHEYVGLASLAVVITFWIWTLVRRGETRLGRLLPWFSIARIRDVMADLRRQVRRMASGRAPDDNDGAFASAIHGLGLLAMTAMAVTGTVYFVTRGAPLARTFLDLHKVTARLMWAYLFAHAGLAVLHHLLGSDIFSRMFWVNRGGRRRSGRTNATGARLTSK